MSAQEEREPLEVEVEVVDAAVPLEERLRTGLVAGGIGAAVAAIALVLVAFGLAVAARWADGGVARALDGTAVLCVVLAAVAGAGATLAIRYGIGPVDEVVDVEVPDAEPEADR